MKLTIFDVCVPMQDQEQCDRMKQVCVDNNLKTPKSFDGFRLYGSFKYFHYGASSEHFSVFSWIGDYTQVTEADFLILLNEYKKTLE